tara:strand:- start:1506 stop:2801 length:1296 start_codon:yes stop_codon:yes gene_type:complete
MNYINSFRLDKNVVSSAGETITYNITGDDEAIFSLRVKNSSGQFYNFSTGVFSATQTTKSRLANQVVSKAYSNVVVIPAAASGDTYTFMLFAEPSKNTLLSDSLSLYNKIYSSIVVSQEKGVYVRVSLSSDQSASRFEGLYDASDATSYVAVTGSASTITNKNSSFSKTVSDPASPYLGYKCVGPSATQEFPIIHDSLQPRDEDFFIKVTTQTNGSGTNSNSMTVDSVAGLVVGMSLVDIADSSDEEQSGTLGVLTYPTITAVNASTKTVTLSTTPTWGDDKAVQFRAYGSNLIGQSSGVSIHFDNWSFTPVDSNSDWNPGANGYVIINGDMSNRTTLSVDNRVGVSIGSYLVSGEVSTTSNANLITAINSDATVVTVTGNQTISDNAKLEVHGSCFYIKTVGDFTVTKFGSADQIVYLDIDKGFVLGTKT